MTQIINTMDNVEESNIGPLDRVAAKVWLFNHIAGNYEVKPTKADLIQQITLIQEELSETKEAIELDNSKELIKETSDLLVTVLGLCYQVELIGHDLMGGADAVCDDNLAKYPLEERQAQASVEYYADHKNVTLTATHNEEYDVWVLKDQQGKIRKPLGFGKIDLSEFIAES